jgi:hypothetical protein
LATGPASPCGRSSDLPPSTGETESSPCSHKLVEWKRQTLSPSNCNRQRRDSWRGCDEMLGWDQHRCRRPAGSPFSSPPTATCTTLSVGWRAHMMRQGRLQKVELRRRSDIRSNLLGENARPAAWVAAVWGRGVRPGNSVLPLNCRCISFTA